MVQEEELVFALLVVLLVLCILQFERNVVVTPGEPELVVLQLFPGLDVVLVLVRPVEVDLLPVVGDRVLLFPGGAPLSNEVALLVVKLEKVD